MTMSYKHDARLGAVAAAPSQSWIQESGDFGAIPIYFYVIETVGRSLLISVAAAAVGINMSALD